jgi:TonB family protein
MADKAKPNLEESRYAPLHLMDRPVELRFGFETQKSGVGVGASVAAHLAAVVVMFLVMRLAPQALPPQVVDDPSVIPLVYLPIPGPGGGGGGGAFRPGAGITLPTVVREVKPAYTADAMRAKVQGSVWLECIVMPDGTVGDVKVTRSLDPIFGLDQEAIKAAKQWRFRPGMRQGQPVPVIITIELTFTLR